MSSAGTDGTTGLIDIAPVGALLADPSRCRMLLALGDGRALPATRLAAEAGVSPATTSSHLRKLTAAGMLAVEQQGRHRFYRLSGPEVGRLLEAMMQLAPVQPIRSLRESTREKALRDARSCYDHLAGRLGVGLMTAMIDRGHLSGGDGHFDRDAARLDHLSGRGHDLDYRLTDTGQAFVDDLGVRPSARRRLIRYCLDWSEQRHHLSGALGCALMDRFIELEWIRRTPASRVISVTPRGWRGLGDAFGLDPR